MERARFPIAKPMLPIGPMAAALACCLAAAACVGPLDRSTETSSDARIDSQAIETGGGLGGIGDEGVPGQASAVDGPEIRAEFVDGPCPFEPVSGHEPRCGTVEVPMDWDPGEGRGDGLIELAVAVFGSTADRPAEDPVIYLDGGPGSHALDTIQFSVDDFLEPLLARGDVIFFDQRGAGHSTPGLRCTETEPVTRRFEDDPELTDDEAIEVFHDALRRCRDRLTADGVELMAFNSINNAHDVEAIRIALGHDRWNLFGISYGTKLGLEVLRRHPDGVRAAVLDSVYPPQVDSTLENPGTFRAAYERVVAACEAESPCRVGGDLGTRIRDLVSRYESEPMQVEVRDWIGDETDEVYVTGETIVEIVLGALYSPSRFTDLPELVTDLEQGRADAVSTFLSQDRTTERFFSNGMFYAIACHEEISFADEAEVTATIPEDPFGLKDAFDFASNTGRLAFGTCEAFENGQAPEVSNSPVESDRPTLLMAGTYDPVTPVSWAERAAEHLPNSQLVVGPYSAHGVSGDACGISIVVDFLDAPDRPVDAGCLDDEPLRFLAPNPAATELEPVTFVIEEFGVEISTVQPVGWFVGSLDGDQYRQESFLDPTELYQLAGDPSLGFVLADFIETEQRLTLGSAAPFRDRVGPIDADDLPGVWSRRTGGSEAVAVEWFETERDGLATYVILVSTVDQLEDNLGAVLLPALTAIEVEAR